MTFGFYVFAVQIGRRNDGDVVADGMGLHRISGQLKIHSFCFSRHYLHKYNIPQLQLFFMTSVSQIILDPLVLTGKPVIRGTRISVDLVLELLASGWHESSILDEYPGLEREDILACIRYAQEIVRSERVYSTSPQEKIPG